MNHNISQLCVIENKTLDEDKLMLNPFFVGISGSDVCKTSLHQIHTQYKKIYIMCVKEIHNGSDFSKLMSLFAHKIKLEDLKEATNMMELLVAPLEVLHNTVFRKASTFVDSQLLERLFPEFRPDNTHDQEIIIMIPTTTSRLMQKYVELFEEPNLMNNLKDIVSLVSTYNNNFRGTISRKLRQMIRDSSESLFWTQKRNTNFNMNDVFNKRQLSYGMVRKELINTIVLNKAKNMNDVFDKKESNQGSVCIEKIISNLARGNIPSSYSVDGKNTRLMRKRSKLICSSENYIEEMNNIEQSIKKLRSEDMNIFHALKTSERRTFYASLKKSSDCIEEKKMVIDILNSITDETIKLEFLVTMLLSKDNCHLIVNNSELLELFGPLIERYKPLFVIVWGYAWNTMYLEESIHTVRSTKNHRFVFELECASKLPRFPFTMQNLKTNPYVTLHLSDDLMTPMTNCMAIDAMKDYEKYYGVCSREEAIKRMNIFTSGKSDRNIFEGMDSRIYSISGSMIPACLQKLNPLFEYLQMDQMNYDEQWNSFFSHYYDESDIDLMCGTKSLMEFIINTSKLIELLCKNIGCLRKDLVIEGCKSSCVVVSKHFFTNCVDDMNEQLCKEYTQEELIAMFEKSNSSPDKKLPQEIVQYFYADYVGEKNRMIRRFNESVKKNGIEIDESLVTSYNSICSVEQMGIKTSLYDFVKKDFVPKDTEVNFFVNDFRSEEEQVPEEENFMVFKYNESIKFKIHSKKMRRSIETFKVNPVDPFNTVARFHKPCVRAYMQGDRFWMLPSFITAMMSMVNIDYKYFAGIRNPIDIINKYRMRGYGVVLNSTERLHMIYYNNMINTCGGMFSMNKNGTGSFGPQQIGKSIIYMTKAFTHRIDPANLYKTNEFEYISTQEELEKLYKDKYNYDTRTINIFNNLAIQSNGSIRPLKRYIMDMLIDP